MTILARCTSPAGDRRPTTSAGTVAALLGVLTVLAGALIFAPAAGAVVTTVAGTTVGLQPRTEALSEGTPETFANNNGNAIVDGANVYAVYWDPGAVFHQHHHEWLTLLDTFFQQMGAGSGSLSTIFSDLGQYRDRANAQARYNTAFKGSYSDSTKYPTAGCTDPNPLVKGAITCLTDAQLREQLQSFVAEQGLPKGMNTVYYLVTPPGVTVCLDAGATSCSDYSLTKTEEEKEERKSVSYKNSFCSYHGDINPDAATEGDADTILYAAIPWTAAGTLGDGFQTSRTLADAQGEDCQDGGWNPEEGEENRERTKILTAEETTALEKEPEPNQHNHREALRLENPHQEEPHQEGKGESGDYSAGLADVIMNQVAVEQANIVTDPLLNGWQDEGGHEVSDECRDVFAGTAGERGIEGSVVADLHTQAGTLSNTTFGEGSYYINNIFNLAGDECAGGVGMEPRFTVPNPVNANEIVGFDGLESTVSLEKGEAFGPSGPPTATYATYTWNFGDGTETSGFVPAAPPCETPWLAPCAGSVFHSYQYGGTYTVTLTVTDVAGNVASVGHEITVVGPPKPAPAAPAAAPANPLSTASLLANGKVVAAPIARAAIISRKLALALRKGVSISYSVNEQVAGHFEILLSRSTARRLHVSGPEATGLAPGSAPQVVIAKAILITTKGGHSTVAIKLSRRTAAELGKTHKLASDTAPDRPQRGGQEPADDNGRQQRHAHPLIAAGRAPLSQTRSLCAACCATCRGTRSTTAPPAGRSRRPSR